MSEQVVNKVKKRIAELEQAVQRLDFVRRHLNQNSSEIKTQIHTAITSHLECLRQREVLLLGQVDGVLVDKEEVLQKQQARLNKALGILHSSLNTAISQASSTISQASGASMDSQQSGSEELDAAATHLLQALEELNSMELKAEETPYIAFRADQLGLKQSIQNYGRVDANGMPLLLAFADVHRPSASLPKHLEEYEDSQHHLFYKTLQDGTANNSSIRVTMPKLSSRVEDWLQRPMLQLTTSGTDLIKSPASESTAGTPMSQSTCAIQNWLSEIKHNPDLEDDDDFEIVDHSTSSPRESPVEEEVCVGEGEECDPLAHISQDSQLWLLKGGNATSPVTTQDELRAFFKHIPKDSSMWLMTAGKQLERLAAAKSVGGEGGWFSHIPTTTSTWLKTRGAQHKTTPTPTASTSDMFQHIPRDHHLWLHSPNKKKVEEEERREQKEGETSMESCESVSSMPEMIKDLNNSQSMDPWLLKYKDQGSAPQKAGLSDLPGIQRYLGPSVNPSSWLARADDRHDQEPLNPNPIFDPFSHISSNLSDWLHSGGKGSGAPSEKSSGTQQWLRPSGPAWTQKAPITSPLESLLASFRQLGTQHWLHQGTAGYEVTEGSDRSWTVLAESPQSSVLSLPFSTTPHIPLLQPSPWVFEHSAQ